MPTLADVRLPTVTAALLAALAVTVAAPAHADGPADPDAGWQLLTRAVQASDALLRENGGSLSSTATSRNTYRYLDEIGPGGWYLRSSTWEPGNEDGQTPDEVSWFAQDAEGAWEYSRYRIPGGRLPLIPARGWWVERLDRSTIPMPSLTRSLLESGPIDTPVQTPQATTVTPLADPTASVVSWVEPDTSGDPSQGMRFAAIVVQEPGRDPLVRSYTASPVTPYYGNEFQETEISYGGNVVARPTGWKTAAPKAYVVAAQDAVGNTQDTAAAVQDTAALGRRLARTESPKTVVRRMSASFDDRTTRYPQIDLGTTAFTATGSSLRIVTTNRYTGQRITWTLTPTRDGRVVVDERSQRVRVRPLPSD